MAVAVKSLTKKFGAQNAVDNVSFTASEGEIVGFLGPNGAGKSTTMKIATGYIPPTLGTITVNDFDVTVEPLEVRKQIGYLPEHNPLYLDMYVKDYLRFAGNLHGLKGKNLRERIGEMIELTGLSIEQNKHIGELSKGYRQRVGLAQALIHDPSVLILDEPTTGLDPNQIVEIRNVIKDISKNKTVIFSTHIMQEVQAICDKVVIINRGTIVADDKVSSLIEKHGEDKVIEVEFAKDIDGKLLEQLPSVSKVVQKEGFAFEVNAADDKAVRSAIFQVSAKNNWDLIQLQVKDVSLENVFRKLTKGGKE